MSKEEQTFAEEMQGLSRRFNENTKDDRVAMTRKRYPRVRDQIRAMAMKGKRGAPVEALGCSLGGNPYCEPTLVSLLLEDRISIVGASGERVAIWDIDLGKEGCEAVEISGDRFIEILEARANDILTTIEASAAATIKSINESAANAIIGAIVKQDENKASADGLVDETELPLEDEKADSESSSEE